MKQKRNRWTLKSTRDRAGRPTVRRVLVVNDTSVRFCDWDGENPHHAHAISYLAPGAIVAVGDDVPLSALGGYIAHHWYRRVGDECLIAHGDGTLCDGVHSAAKD